MPQQDDIFFEEEQPNTTVSARGESSFPGGEPEPEKPKGGVNRRTLMLLLMLLVIAVAGAYLFIMPSTAPEIVQTPPPVKKKVVKLPVRKSPETKPASVAKPEPAPAQVQAKPEPKPVSAEQAVKKEVLPASPVVAVEKVAEAPVAPAPVEEAEKAVAPAKQPYTLQVGAYILESSVKEASRVVEKLGYAPRLLQGKKTVEMTRLHVGSYDTAEQGQARLDELRALAPAAFAVWENKQMTIYAGSYFSLDRARFFADRLYAEGLRVEEVNVTVQVDITTMQYGAFADRAAAEKAVASASDAGLEVLVVKTR